MPDKPGGRLHADTRSIFATLKAQGVVVSDLARRPALRLPAPYEGWLSDALPSSAGLPFRRLLILDIPAPLAVQASLHAGNLLQALQLVSALRATTVAVCMDHPAFSDDTAGYFSRVRMIFYAATHYGALSRWPVSRISLLLSPGLRPEQINLQVRKLLFNYDNPLAGVVTAGGNTPWKDALKLIRWDGKKHTDPALTERQRIMIYFWTTNLFIKLQRALRLNDFNAPDFIACQACITGISTGLANLVSLDSPAPVLRTQNITEVALEDYRRRADMFHPGFTASCLDTLFAQEASACLRIRSRTGKVIMHLSEYPEEREVLFDKGMTDCATEDILSPGEISYLNIDTGQIESRRYDYILTSEQIDPLPVTHHGGE